MLDVPDSLAPSMRLNSTDTGVRCGCAFSLTRCTGALIVVGGWVGVHVQCMDCRRAWLVPFAEDVTKPLVFVGFVLGALLALLFFVEQVRVACVAPCAMRDVGGAHTLDVTLRGLLPEYHHHADEYRVESPQGNVIPL